MPPKAPLDKLPKPIQELKELLMHGEWMALDIESIGKVPHAARSKAYGALAAKLKASSPEKAAQYQNSLSEIEKREWLLAYLLDPETGGTIKNLTERITEHEVSKVRVWLTKAQLAGPSFLNSAEHADIVFKSG